MLDIRRGTKLLVPGGDGFVTVLDWMGSDATIAEDTRVSTGSVRHGAKADERLLNYLVRNRHTSPIEFGEVKLHVKLPIFVARQWIRHRTASVSELSGRYAELPFSYYQPERFHAQDTRNKQGSAEPLESRLQVEASAVYARSVGDAYERYLRLIEIGVSREQARMVLPVSMYTEMRWKIDLHNLLHFLKLRLAPDAQEEIRSYARVIAWVARTLYPTIWAAFEEYDLYSVRLSGSQVDHLNQAIRDREWSLIENLSVQPSTYLLGEEPVCLQPGR